MVAGSIRPAVVFALPSHAPLAAELREDAGLVPGELEYRHFPDGERYLRILTPVIERDVVVVGGTTSDTDTLDLFDLSCGLVKEGVRSLSLVIPFYGYSTMERAVRPGEIVVAKSRARLLSSIPLARGGNRVALLDLHVDGITYYFEGGVVPHHLYAKPIILEAARELGGSGFALGSVDAGRAKWVESLANDLGVTASFILKRRLSDRRTEVMALTAAVQGSPVVIYDDMIRSGGSLLGAARAYLDAGATRISAIATHGLFPEDSLARIKDSGLIDRLVCTNSHPAAMGLAGKDPFLSVRSCAPLFRDFLTARRRAAEGSQG
jgi:ribose-phosphate pyrophosphokinase